MNFSDELIIWYEDHKRDLPFRHTNNPYKIWLSEIILQQTKVDQGLPYYYKFIDKFPDITSLANADEDLVLKLWQGLGYYSRARNLHFSAKFIRDNYNGLFPSSYKQILSLKGVGLYTAAAISSFAFNLPYSVVDGNVIRVLSRVFGISTEFDTNYGINEFRVLAQDLLPENNHAIYNQAIMEFGALSCKPKKPLCSDCIFDSNCYALKNDLVYKLPKKKNKIKVRDRFIHFLIINKNKKIYLSKNSEGVWTGLYQFPYLELDKQYSNDDVEKSDAWSSFFQDFPYLITRVSTAIKHKLSHQRLSVVFWHITCDEIILDKFNLFDPKLISDLPVSSLTDKYLLVNSIN